MWARPASSRLPLAYEASARNKDLSFEPIKNNNHVGIEPTSFDTQVITPD